MTGNFTDSEMRDINRCRVFLQIECLPDVCTADSLTTDPGLQAQPPTVVSQSTIKWPLQAIPGPRSWAVWRQFLNPYTRDSTNNRLRQTLGPWTRPGLRNWPTYYDSSSQMLCQIVSQTNTATLGTFSTFWTYHPAAIEPTFSPSTPLLLSALLAVSYAVYRFWLFSPYPSAAFGSPIRFFFSILIFPLSIGLHFCLYAGRDPSILIPWTAAIRTTALLSLVGRPKPLFDPSRAHSLLPQSEKNRCNATFLYLRNELLSTSSPSP
jgi:hypothetical protein